MTFNDMLYGYYYWISGELYLCVKVVPTSDTEYGSVMLKPVARNSGSWYSFKYWGKNTVRQHNP